MAYNQDINLNAVEKVAKALEELNDEVIFVLSVILVLIL